MTAAEQLPFLLTIDDIRTLLRVGRTTAYARTREADFPDPFVLSGSSYRWGRDDVLKWLEAQRAPKKPTAVKAQRAPVKTDRADLGELPAPRPVTRRKRREAVEVAA